MYRPKNNPKNYSENNKSEPNCSDSTVKTNSIEFIHEWNYYNNTTADTNNHKKATCEHNVEQYY